MRPFLPRLLSTTLLASALALAGITAVPGVEPAPRPLVSAVNDGVRIAPPRIQIAILLDTSGSMEGLIHQARSQIWAIVNSLGHATRDGQLIHLEVALYEYGQTPIPAEEQHLRQVVPFTQDLDRLSAALFALTTNGGEEYCGAVIRAAHRGLTWSSDPRDLRIMVIAGNEPFTQGTIPSAAACIEAASDGIAINTIYCGAESEGRASGWTDGANMGLGIYASIDQQRAVVIPPTPQEDELARLGISINATYLPYGNGGAAGLALQGEQDSNSSSISKANSASRAYAKGSGQYCNSHWDLVDAVDRKAVDLAKVPEADLPPALRELTLADRRLRIATLLAERRRIQARIAELGLAREHFLQAQAAAAGTPRLDDAIIAAIRGQAEVREFVVNPARP